MLSKGDLTVSELLALVNEQWPTTVTEYPRLEGLSESDKRDYLIRHVFHHLYKSVGRLAVEVERIEHSKPGTDHIQVNRAGEEACKLMVCAAKIATLINLSGDGVALGIDHVLKKN